MFSRVVILCVTSFFHSKNKISYECSKPVDDLLEKDGTLYQSLDSSKQYADLPMTLTSNSRNQQSQHEEK